MEAAHHREFLLAGPLQQIAAGLARRAAPDAPGRALAPPRHLEIPFALDQVLHPHVDAEPAAEFSGAAGIGAQPAALAPPPGISARCPRSSRCARRPGRPRRCRTRRPRTAGRPSRRPRCSAPRSGVWSSDACRRTPPRRRAAHDARPARGPASPWPARLTMAVDHRRHDAAPARHRRGEARHHDVAFGDDDLERAERAFVDRIERAGQRLVGDARAGIGARVDRGLALGRAAGQVDGHVAGLDRDLDVDRHLFALEHAVVVDRGRRLVDAVGQLRHHVAALLLGLVEDAVDGGEQRVAAVFVEQLVEPARRRGGTPPSAISCRRARIPESGCCP